MSTQVKIIRSEAILTANPRRVIAKLFVPGDEMLLAGKPRSSGLYDRIMSIPEAEVPALLEEVRVLFAGRHRELEEIWLRHYGLITANHHHRHEPPSRQRRLLVGAYFTHEYSVEAAALFNPSIVAAPDQSNLSPGQLRFVMSLRAVGEGHISSIELRSGTISGDGEVTLDPVSGKLETGSRAPPKHYVKHMFAAKLRELGAGNDIAFGVLSGLPDAFTQIDLDRSLALLESVGPSPAITYETAKIIRVLAASNYVASFPASSRIDERVIFPAGPNETRGMEDARFVRFVEADGTGKYYATYTAYDGFQILPQLIETEDFYTFTISTLNGAAAQNKGMALFPRQVGGKYLMFSRKDREALYLASSDDVHNWSAIVDLYHPSLPWELVQLGNCGSPLETSEGWLVLTHGVGPMRRYTIGAVLLDLDDPKKMIGRLEHPLLTPDDFERDGYVPNVLYSCGGLIHGDWLVLPYGYSDHAIRVAKIGVGDLLDALKSPAARR